MNNPFKKSQSYTLPPIQFQGYWEKEFSGAYGSEEGKRDDWDPRAYLYWNNLLNQLAEEGENL